MWHRVFQLFRNRLFKTASLICPLASLHQTGLEQNGQDQDSFCLVTRLFTQSAEMAELWEIGSDCNFGPEESKETMQNVDNYYDSWTQSQEDSFSDIEILQDVQWNVAIPNPTAALPESSVQPEMASQLLKKTIDNSVNLDGINGCAGLHTKHGGKKRNERDLYEKAFCRPDSLKTYFRTHTEETVFQCSQCQRLFSREHNLLNHERRCRNGEKMFKCALCVKAFSQSGHLRTHFRTHTGEKPFNCMSCDKSFYDKCNYSRHLKVHMERPFQCALCNKSFPQSVLLEAHAQRHTAEKRFKCNSCDKTFSVSRDLEVHTRTHTGEKPYQCEFCAKCFSQASNLISHTRIHTGEKPYQCNQCQRAFSRKFILQNHERSRHKSVKLSRV